MKVIQVTEASFDEFLKDTLETLDKVGSISLQGMEDVYITTHAAKIVLNRFAERVRNGR